MNAFICGFWASEFKTLALTPHNDLFWALRTCIHRMHVANLVELWPIRESALAMTYRWSPFKYWDVPIIWKPTSWVRITCPVWTLMIQHHVYLLEFLKLFCISLDWSGQSSYRSCAFTPKKLAHEFICKQSKENHISFDCLLTLMDVRIWRCIFIVAVYFSHVRNQGNEGGCATGFPA